MYPRHYNTSTTVTGPECDVSHGDVGAVEPVQVLSFR